MVRQRVGTSLYAGFLFTVLGLVAWASGQPFVFPSLGPSAFILAFDRRGERTRTYRIVGSHLIGGVVGLTAYTVFAAGISITATHAAFSPDGLRLAGSGVLSIIVTSWGMIATNYQSCASVRNDIDCLARATLDATASCDYRYQCRYPCGSPRNRPPFL